MKKLIILLIALFAIGVQAQKYNIIIQKDTGMTLETYREGEARTIEGITLTNASDLVTTFKVIANAGITTNFATLNAWIPVLANQSFTDIDNVMLIATSLQASAFSNASHTATFAAAITELNFSDTTNLASAISAVEYMSGQTITNVVYDTNTSVTVYFE